MRISISKRKETNSYLCICMFTIYYLNMFRWMVILFPIHIHYLFRTFQQIGNSLNLSTTTPTSSCFSFSRLFRRREWPSLFPIRLLVFRLYFRLWCVNSDFKLKYTWKILTASLSYFFCPIMLRLKYKNFIKSIDGAMNL